MLVRSQRRKKEWNKTCSLFLCVSCLDIHHMFVLWSNLFILFLLKRIFLLYVLTRLFRFWKSKCDDFFLFLLKIQIDDRICYFDKKNHPQNCCCCYCPVHIPLSIDEWWLYTTLKLVLTFIQFAFTNWTCLLCLKRYTENMPIKPMDFQFQYWPCYCGTGKKIAIYR